MLRRPPDPNGSEPLHAPFAWRLWERPPRPWSDKALYVDYALKRAWHDGTRELVFEPLEFLERLAAMTPRPETNLLICHGVLAPRARWRGRVVVNGRRVSEPTASTVPLATGLDGTGVKTASPRAWSWAALMHRAFGIDVLACAQCGGRLRLIATLHDPAVIREILAQLALGHFEIIGEVAA